MKPERSRMMTGTKRFGAGRRHYHQSQQADDDQWDDFLGEKIKGPLRRKFDQMMHVVGTLVAGCLLLVGILWVLFFVMGKILPMIGK